MKKIWLLILSCGLLYTAVYSAENSSGSFRFAHLLSETRPEQGEIQVNGTPGDTLKIFFQPLNNTYLYLLLVSPDYGLRILSPGADLSFKKEYATMKQFISSDESWFAGVESEGDYSLFYLFSQNRLSGLEKNLREYTAAESEAGKEKIVKRILAEIRQLRRDNQLKSNLAELPAFIIGTFRHEEDTVAESLMKLHFSDEDILDEDNPVPGFTDSIREQLEETAVIIQFHNISINEIRIEYHAR